MPSLTENLLGAYSPDEVVALVEVSHPDLDDPIRVTNDGAPVTSNGDVYQNYGFRIELPGDGEKDPVGRLAVGNVDRLIGDAIDQISTPATVSISLVQVSDPDTLERSWLYFELRNTVRDALVITGDVPIRQFNNEPFPNIRVRPGNFQNLYV